MNRLILFDRIILPLPEKAIDRRLGYKKGVTQRNFSESVAARKYMDDALACIRLRGVALRTVIDERSDDKICFSPGKCFESRALADMLKSSSEVLIMAATAGSDIMDAIRRDTEGADVTRGVVLDATASEVVDAALDWIVSYFNQILRRENKAVTKSRFSAGYGDFALRHQLLIHEILQLENIGVSITDSFMLAPEKSVTAVAGIVG